MSDVPNNNKYPCRFICIDLNALKFKLSIGLFNNINIYMTCRQILDTHIPICSEKY